MKIGELAKAARCTTATVRFYEKEGLLFPAHRSEGNYRRYGPAHVERLRFVRNCRMLDMTHDEIRTLLGMMDRPAADCGVVNHLLDEHIEHVEVRLRELLQLKQQLVTLRERCDTRSSVKSCGILHGLAEMETEPKPARPTHLG